MLDLNSSMPIKTVSVVCYDAGATNIIVEWLKKHPELNVRAHLGGPAVDIWNTAFPGAVNYALDEAIDGSDQLISGTGWASDLEYKARKASLKKRIPTIAVIDNWVNYEERFIRKGIKIYPDVIWVVDRFAFSLATEVFPSIPIRLIANDYLDAQVEAIHDIQRIKTDPKVVNILYILEPIRQDWSEDKRLPGEFQALDYFMKNSHKISNLNYNIMLRPHPSDRRDKYLPWISNQDIDIQISMSRSLEQDVAWSDIVVGCQSYALVVALKAGKQVFSCLPPYAPSLMLPYPGIQELRKL